MRHRHGKQATIRARDLRFHATDAERKLWYKLRELKPLGYHFRRQAPFPEYFLDFAEHSARLVVELDGSQHGLPEQSCRDEKRDAFLRSRGYLVLHFWNDEANENLAGVVETILRELRARHPHPSLAGRKASAESRPPRKGEVKVTRPLPRKGLRRIE